jgi:hypothetical protein
MTEKLDRKKMECTASNGRFGAMAAVALQTILWKFGRYYPAESLVKPPLRQYAGTLAAMAQNAVRIFKKNIDFQTEIEYSTTEKPP